MATSADGIRFHRTPGRRTMIPCGKPGERDVQIAGVASGVPVTDGDETSLYYYGLRYRHAEIVYAKGPQDRHTYRAVWRRCGFASIGSSMQGAFVTKPVILGTADLRLNVAPVKDPFRGASSARVRVLATNGTILAESAPVTADSTRAKLVRTRGSVPVNRPVRIRVDLHAASIYALECF